MPPLSWWLVGGAIVAVAFLLRVGVHVGRTPGGVDTWYYLAYADALRRKPALDVELPQYLLQDVKQSYPPLFPTLLALLGQRTLQRFFWVVSPAVDCLHLLLLYFVTFRLTASLAVAALAAAAYACTPHLVSETRSLSARPFGALLHSIAMICLLKYTLTGGAWVLARGRGPVGGRAVPVVRRDGCGLRRGVLHAQRRVRRSALHRSRRRRARVRLRALGRPLPAGRPQLPARRQLLAPQSAGLRRASGAALTRLRGRQRSAGRAARRLSGRHHR
jgi:hypothetical protein